MTIKKEHIVNILEREIPELEKECTQEEFEEFMKFHDEEIPISEVTPILVMKTD